jgi:formylglycine-generating enzyme required for sulfatase activity
MRVFPWGDESEGTRLNYCDANCEWDWADEVAEDGYRDTALVGSHPEGASWCDVLDMAGKGSLGLIITTSQLTGFTG